MSTSIFESFESNVRSYSRSYPIVFHKAKGSFLYTDTGKEYIDFLMGAGALNYGHNNSYIKSQLIEYMHGDYIMQGLDMYTVAKGEFIHAFNKYILQPSELDYKFQFCGPTGTNAVEAALKLARNYTGRSNIISFMGGYHGLSSGSLAVTSNQYHRNAAGTTLNNVTFIPFETGSGAKFDSLAYLKMILEDGHSGIEKPAAVIMETVQAEGGVNVASHQWLGALKRTCEQHKILFICDDIQVGCGRSGDFFSFQRANIIPDIVILSKSISGYGLPMSMLLIKPELDIWKPGEHNGTFRGYQLAFVGGKAALEFRETTALKSSARLKSIYIQNFLDELAEYDPRIRIRGIGMIWGIDLSAFDDPCLSQKIREECFKKQLILECVGREDKVIKLLPPLTIEDDVLHKALSILKQSLIKNIGAPHRQLDTVAQ